VRQVAVHRRDRLTTIHVFERRHRKVRGHPALLA
jgi:hypothetical protein